MCGSLPPSDLLLPGERLDDLQCGGYRLIQRPDAFRFGTDSVLLADFAAPRPRTRAVDLGCGTGAVATLMAAHEPTLTVDAVELQPDVADMARRSVRLNRLEDRVSVFAGDMRVGKNTSRSASVEFLRSAQKLCARQSASLFKRKPSEAVFV